MNILVTGANGQLGNEMRIVTRTSHDTYIFTDVVEMEGQQTTLLDITSLEAVQAIVKQHDIRCIINCAAYTNVDKAETDEVVCKLLNATAVNNLSIAMKEVDGILIHISTDYVFGGDPYNTPCKEVQKGTPTGVYGYTKLEGENNILASGCHHIIIRTAWLYSTFGNNFVKTMLRLGAERTELGVVFDQIGTPTYARDLARTIHHILCHAIIPGIYHYSNEGACSWYDFTKAIFTL
jgi:dTDP-4-dehydrorhamnose reductase